MISAKTVIELEDLMVLKRSPDLLNNVKLGQDQCDSPNEWPWMKGHRSAWHLVLI